MAARQTGLITRYGLESPFAEVYRNLRTNLMLANGQTSMQSLAVVGARPGVGTSTTAANLAITMAEVSTELVLVDCDLRRPTIHRLFGVKESPGLGEILAGKAELSKTLVESGVQRLKLLPAGKVSTLPTVLLGSEAMQRILRQLREMASLIILDTPAAAVFPDAVILASYVDGVLLVTRAGYAHTPVYEEMRRRLASVHAHVLGAVLNDVRPGDHEGLAYYRDYVTRRR